MRTVPNLGDQFLSMIKPGEAVYYYHNDHLGTPQVLTDDTGTIAWKAVYTPFGEAVASIQRVENPFRFPGQYYDQETGLHYNYFRYYNPQTGRYITPDPIGLEGGINLFAYVANNPLIRFDMFGLREPFLGTELDPGYLPSYEESGLEAIAEGVRYGWKSGYYPCYLKCLGGPLGIYAVIHFAAEFYNQPLGKGTGMIYKHYTDGRFTAWGKRSGKIVPEIGKKIAKYIKGSATLWLAIHAWYCIYECMNHLEECQ